ncbi:hypothetical protein BEH94_10570 [Candidatus Altiarchaeales archaeon WOR_SM1_SCG]|nr:hypothetical protein BEH94_10570 [Candidatus Altiarchaeales archaeon WOR_SM1_SCG]
MKITQNPVGYLDAVHDGEKYLRENFVRTSKYDEILNPNCLYISGRKGDGTSVIALMLMKEKDKNGELLYKYEVLIRNYEFYHSIAVDLREASLSRVAGYESPIKDRINMEYYFQKLWEYVIYVSAMRGVIEKNSGEGLILINDFLENNNFPAVGERNFFDCFLDIFGKDLEILYKKEDDLFFPVATSLTRRVNDRLNDPNFIGALKTLRNHISKNNRVLIVIDTIEKYYVNEEEFQKAVQGMMQAVYEIKHNNKNRWIDIKCFIPDELYEDFAAWNLYKVTDSTVFLEWKYKELLHLICKRYMTYLKKNYSYQEIKEYETKWNNLDKNSRDSIRCFLNEFFPETIKSRFGANEDCFNYILRHTQNKPRQVIHLVNNIINCAEANGRAPKISQEDVYEGVHRDMDQLIGVAFMAFSHQYRELLQYIKRMFHGQENILRGRVVRECIKKGGSTYVKMGLDAEDVERILLRSGLVGIVSKQTKMSLPSGKEIGVYHTLFEYLTRGHLEMTDESLCAVHPMLTGYYGNNMAIRENSYVVPYGGLYYEGEDDNLITKKNRK